MGETALLARVRAEVYEVIAPEYGTAPGRVSFDEKEGLWVCVKQLPVPPALTKNRSGKVDVLMLVPMAYPQVPPDGFYCDMGLNITNHYFLGWRDKHYPEWQRELLQNGWQWFCAHAHNVNQSGWKATNSPKRGDNLMSYLHLCLAILGKEGNKNK
jgi:hypothetical protein